MCAKGRSACLLVRVRFELDQRSKEAKKQRNEHNAALAGVFLLGEDAPLAGVFLLGRGALAKAAAGVFLLGKGMK